MFPVLICRTYDYDEWIKIKINQRIMTFTGCFGQHGVCSSPKVTVAAWESGVGAVRTLDTLACVTGPGDKVGQAVHSLLVVSVFAPLSPPPPPPPCPCSPSLFPSFRPAVLCRSVLFPHLSFPPTPEALVVPPTYSPSPDYECTVTFTKRASL